MSTETIDMADTLTQPAPTEAPSAPQAPDVDPAAPYGRTKGGRARKAPLSGRRGRPKGSRTTTIGAKGQSRKPAGKSGPTDYRPAILRMSTMLTMPLAFRAPVDAWTIDAHMRGEDTAESPGLARAISNLAAEEPQVAAVLDRLMTAGPYAEVIGAAIPMVVQLLTNHRRIPLQVAQTIGAVDPAAIAEGLAAQGEQMAAAA